LSEGHAWRLACDALERVLSCAQDVEVRVALEPCWGTLAHGRFRAEHMLAALECAELAVNFDPSHHVLCGDGIPGAVRAWGGRMGRGAGGSRTCTGRTGSAWAAPPRPRARTRAAGSSAKARARLRRVWRARISRFCCPARVRCRGWSCLTRWTRSGTPG